MSSPSAAATPWTMRTKSSPATTASSPASPAPSRRICASRRATMNSTQSSRRQSTASIRHPSPDGSLTEPSFPLYSHEQSPVAELRRGICLCICTFSRRYSCAASEDFVRSTALMSIACEHRYHTFHRVPGWGRASRPSLYALQWICGLEVILLEIPSDFAFEASCPIFRVLIKSHCF